MKPYLNVLGRKHTIISVGVKSEGTGEVKNFFDKETFPTLDENEKVDFSTSIAVPDKYEQFLSRLEQTIDESVEYLTDLKLQLADRVLESRDLPFPEVDSKHLIEEITAQVSFIEGLELALEEMKKVEQPSIVDDEEEEEDLRWLGKSINVPKEFWGSKNEEQS